jgi:DNA-binding beta-propeller fold protein YncE
MFIKSLKFIFYLFFVIGMVACSKNTRLQKSKPEVVVYPSPPDTVRIQFLKSFNTSIDVEGQRSKFGVFLAGEVPPKPIIKPYGVTMHDGKIYLCDLDMNGLEIMDLANESFEYFTPKGLGKLQLPINCFVDSLGYLFIADSKRKQVVIYNENHEYVNSLGGNEKDKPTDVFVVDGKIWVADVANGRVDVYKNDSTYQFLYSIPKDGVEDAKLYQPTNLFVSPEKVYVSDFGEFNIKIYDHEGNFLNKIGSYGKNLGQFARPKGIAVDREGILYVVDAAFENVQMFDKEGKLLMFFGGSYQGPGDMWLPAKVSISYEGLEYFQKYVDDNYTLKYLVLVTNNFGPDRLNVYGYIEEKSTINK